MVPSQLFKLARKHKCVELKSVWDFFGWLSGDKAKRLWLFASGESNPEYGYTPYVNRTDKKGQCKKAARGN